jgi:hypothetical protein
MVMVLKLDHTGTLIPLTRMDRLAERDVADISMYQIHLSG